MKANSLVNSYRCKALKILLMLLSLFNIFCLQAQTPAKDLLNTVLFGRNRPIAKNKNLSRDTAAVLNFNTKPSTEFTTSNIQDISGIWEGEESDNNNLIKYYKICLLKINSESYSGFDYYSYAKNIDRSPINARNGEVPQESKSFIGKFKSGELEFIEIQNITNSNGPLKTEKFKFVNDNGSTSIINNNNQSATKIYLKRTSQAFPQEYLKYAVTENTLEIDNPVFLNSKNEGALKFNDHGKLSLSIKNSSEINLSNLDGRVTTTETDNGIIDYDKLYGNFNIAKSETLKLPLQINTNFSVPRQDIHLNIVFSYHSIVLAQKTLAIPTESFYKTSAVSVPEYTSPRMKAVSGYYGLTNTPYEDVSRQLEPLVASGDKTALMWKAMMLSMGNGGYKIDEANAYTMGKASFSNIENKARNGDAEALYLMFYACQMGLEGKSAISLGNDFLKKSASAGFLPALYDEALQYNMRKDYSAALTRLLKIYNSGLKKSAQVIGFMYEKGYGDNKNIATAIEWYNKGISFGDPQASLAMANLYSNGFNDTPPDISKAMKFAELAASKNCTGAMVFIGMKYFDGKQGVARSIPDASKWFKAGADLGDRQAMLALGETFLSGGTAGVVKDERSGLFWIKKAAESGSPKAMMILSKYYNEGTIAEKNIVAGRYWYNQAVLNGYAKPDATGINAMTDSFLDFWKYADFSPSYVYVDEHGSYVRDGDDGLLNGLFTGLAGSMISYYQNQQQLIDGLEDICKKNGYKIYGGTVSSDFISNLYLKQGQTIIIKSYGIVSTGQFSGLATADGLGARWPEYRLIQDIPCSAVMAEVKDSKWQFIGQSASYTAPKDGPLSLALNAIDYKNYKGYFDVVIEVPEN